LEALNVEHRLAQLEADEILRREDSLRITQQEDDEKTHKATLDALIVRIDELDMSMVGLRNEVWRESDNEGVVRQGSGLSSWGGSRGSKRTPWCKPPWSSSSSTLPPTDRRLHMMAEEAPPIWDIKAELTEDSLCRETAYVRQQVAPLPQRADLPEVPNPPPRRWTGLLAHVGQASRETTDACVSDTCLSKELRENTAGTYSSTYSNPWRSAVEVLRLPAVPSWPPRSPHDALPETRRVIDVDTLQHAPFSRLS